MSRWYITETTRASWPGLGRYRGELAAENGHGYADFDSADARRMSLLCAWAARNGACGPDLRVMFMDADAGPVRPSRVAA